MAYITSSDYLSFAGGDLPADFEELACRACDMIDQRVLYAWNGVSSLSEEQTLLFKRACCAQTQWLDLKGGAQSLCTPLTTEATLGKFSYTADSAKSFSPLAEGYLYQAGLLYAGVGTI